MRLFSIVSAAAIAVAALSITSDALAQRNRGNNQSASMVVVNSQRVLAESAIGRDMAAKLQTVRTQINTDAQALGPERQSIEQEMQRLQTTLRNQSAEQIRNNPQAQAVAQRQQALQQRAATLQGDMQCSELMALREINRIVQPVVRSVMQSRGAGIVLDASSVSEVSPEYDVTSAVIQQLDGNEATRTINVARHSVAECEAQQPAQAPAQ